MVKGRGSVEDACREEESGVHGELAAQGVGAAAGCVTVSRWQWHGELASHLKLIGFGWSSWRSKGLKARALQAIGWADPQPAW